MFAKRRAQQRHNRLMAAADHLVLQAVLRPGTRPEEVTSEEVVAFGRHGIRIEASEAGDYLAAVLVTRGHKISSLSAGPA
ncbi:hypothetical protein ACH4FE_35745 [Streptomyces celluloflavus]|uniref:hypothetical protein n=1 Tax=Streptomyces celluloflavus TaxID=58344 RepID=UPI003787B01F